MMRIYHCVFDSCPQPWHVSDYDLWEEVFMFFWAQVTIAALFDALWEVGVWGNNPEWVELLFDEALVLMP